MKKLNKKGAEMTIGTIIIIVLALVVLVVLIVGFTGGWTNLWDKIKAFFGGGDNVGTMVTACQTACASNLQYDYCSKERVLKFGDKSDRDGTYNCMAMQGMSLGLSCDKNFENCAAIKPCRKIGSFTGTAPDSCPNQDTKAKCDAVKAGDSAVCEWK